VPRLPSLGLWPRPTKRASVFGTCRLPIVVPIEQTGRVTDMVGWLDVPTGTFQPDLASALDAIKESKANVPSPYTWDPAVEEWVPAPAKLISPDGRSYVWGDDVFNAKTGAIVHRIPFPTPPNRSTGAFYAVAYTGAAIYFAGTGMQPPPGLWAVQTTSWKVTQVSSAEGEWDLVDAKSAWGTNGYTVRRLDLATSKVYDLYRGSPSLDFPVLVGFVGSGVLLLSPNGSGSDSPVLSVLVLNPNGSVTHFGVPPDLGDGRLGAGVQDGSAFIFTVWYALEPGGPPASLHGWGLAAWDPSHGLQFLMTKFPEGLSGLSVAGPCMAV
jgi:hypothetical protein